MNNGTKPAAADRPEIVLELWNRDMVEAIAARARLQGIALAGLCVVAGALLFLAAMRPPIVEDRTPPPAGIQVRMLIDAVGDLQQRLEALEKRRVRDPEKRPGVSM